MITHFIRHPDNKTTQYPVTTSTSYPGYNGVIPRVDRRGPMDKLEFTKHLESKGLKVGDFVVRDGCKPPFGVFDIQRIVYIEEIHSLIPKEDWSYNGTPMAYTCQGWDSQSALPNQKWNHKSALDYIRKEPVSFDDLPYGWQSVVIKEREADQKAEQLANDYSSD